MKITVDFSALWSEVGKISKDPAEFVLDSYLQPRDTIDFELEGGKDVSLDDVDFDGPVASVQGRQVLLYIPDHGSSFEKAVDNPEWGKKFHVTFCKTLEEMKAKNRFERYTATNDLSGMFKITGTDYGRNKVAGTVPLRVCKFCLMRLNYQNALSSVSLRQKIANSFNIAKFFETFSSCFRYMPSGISSAEVSGYTDDWKKVSNQIRRNVKFICQGCKVDLSNHKKLLHVHHCNGVKNDNSLKNLKALCADCHRKEPHHEHMHIPHNDTQTINRLRREQALILSDWDDVERLADPAVLGLLGKLRSKSWKAPEIGFELENAKGEVIAEFEAAWPERKVGLVISRDSVENFSDWQIKTLGEFIKELA